MSSWLVWGVFAIAAVLLGWIGYHFTVRTLRFVTAGFALAVAMLVTRYGVTHPGGAPTDLVNAFARGMDKLCTAFLQPLLGGQLLAHGRVVWLVIIAVLVFAYRELEVWASSGIFNHFLNAQRQTDYPTDKLNHISTHV